MVSGTAFGDDELAKRRFWAHFVRGQQDLLYGIENGTGEDPGGDGLEEDEPITVWYFDNDVPPESQRRLLAQVDPDGTVTIFPNTPDPIRIAPVKQRIVESGDVDSDDKDDGESRADAASVSSPPSVPQGNGLPTQNCSVRLSAFEGHEMRATAICECSALLPQAIIFFRVDAPEEFSDPDDVWLYCLRINPPAPHTDAASRFELWVYVEGTWTLEGKWDDDDVHTGDDQAGDPLADLTEALQDLPIDGCDPLARAQDVFLAVSRLRGGALELV